MTNCSRCGSPIEADDKFCASCGARTAEAPSALKPEGSSRRLGGRGREMVAGVGGTSRRKGWAVVAVVVVVIAIVVAAGSGSSSSNGWTAADKAQAIQGCESAGSSTQACDCAETWLEAHLSPSQLQAAPLNGTYVTDGEQMVAACPGAGGSGLLGQ